MMQLKAFTEEHTWEGDIEINGPTNQVSIDINGETKSGTSITIPQSNNYTINDFLLYYIYRSKFLFSAVFRLTEYFW
jgi:hypothetical protein